MRHYFVCTGVDLQKKIIKTRVYDNTQAIAGLLEAFDPEVA